MGILLNRSSYYYQFTNDSFYVNFLNLFVSSLHIPRSVRHPNLIGWHTIVFIPQRTVQCVGSILFLGPLSSPLVDTFVGSCKFT